jgi:hypothetical protein
VADDKRDDTVENAQIGYQAAVNLWTYEGGAIWARFNAMLVANSIVIAVIGIALTSEPAKGKLADFTSIAGLVLSIIWWLLNTRGFDYHNHWIHSAKELEALLPPVKTVSGNKRFSLAGRLPTRWASCAAIGVFAAMYVAVLVGVVDSDAVPGSTSAAP